ncbi:hypothetical protein [Streptomyces xantholiticus]|nr:hypothetical protein [Streptomyces xantholiticus]GGW56756.1 hypothetical protein GCM10010381_47720 [Streptomyces xantholiticus]
MQPSTGALRLAHGAFTTQARATLEHESEGSGPRDADNPLLLIG